MPMLYSGQVRVRVATREKRGRRARRQAEDREHMGKGRMRQAGELQACVGLGDSWTYRSEPVLRHHPCVCTTQTQEFCLLPRSSSKSTSPTVLVMVEGRRIRGANGAKVW